MDDLKAKITKESVEDFCRLTGIKPAVVTGDLHPAYRSSRLADDLVASIMD